MKLYYAPGTCSLSPHITLQEAGLPFTLELVDIYAKTTASGADFNAINAKGAVPVLELDSGERLTEGPAIVQYIADLKPESGLVAQAGTMERYHQLEWLNFITSDLHKGLGLLFAKDLSDEVKDTLKGKLTSKFALVDAQLQKTPYITGESFTVPDGYLFTVLRWCKFLGIDLSVYTAITRFMALMATRPAVQAAMKTEEIN